MIRIFSKKNKNEISKETIQEDFQRRSSLWHQFYVIRFYTLNTIWYRVTIEKSFFFYRVVQIRISKRLRFYWSDEKTWWSMRNSNIWIVLPTECAMMIQRVKKHFFGSSLQSVWTIKRLFCFSLQSGPLFGFAAACSHSGMLLWPGLLWKRAQNIV